MKALILAGSQEDCYLSKSCCNKALIKICGKEMIKYIIDAMKALEFIDTVAVVGPKEELLPIENHVDIIVDGGPSMIDNILKGVEIFPDEDLILISTSDIPMITPEAIRDFVEKSLESDAEFYYPIVRKEANEKKYPKVKRTYVKIKDGTFTGGNLVLVKVSTVKKCIKQAENFMIYRKKPWKLAQILGIGTVFRFLMGTLTIEQLEKRVSDLFGIKAQAVISDYPEIGTDVDKESDLELAERVLS
ncbi:Molybdopterin-guanine dinucleotide biosynthesis protein A-like protein [Tepidanaerobacter acetatoxydans Re1]|uniref:Molybdopterin-guanine dinucleotide biosynthesis protein A-like protein n=1 Tax=Tepidanaerobacter acetatoxydans (strain DSM 21804 / JCM 16047 / Re1) TaxID=1209989 RepID=F4LS36_TEPAE|nr:NTP transferase domain-containing protein [Tepidanaerobacter acetatoxydans]AEE90299.1 molybdopterin-guanine dinucleotide biosynthesis protein A-like protein [Tepidanaerobacter acetatoxydans Re1]CDI40283.1 Molybdopterin-guanine dinucleotide biosynthesis protein A-like protein [Tepidanaerobacter acetatoxydans Re1]